MNSAVPTIPLSVVNAILIILFLGLLSLIVKIVSTHSLTVCLSFKPKSSVLLNKSCINAWSNVSSMLF